METGRRNGIEINIEKSKEMKMSKKTESLHVYVRNKQILIVDQYQRKKSFED